MLLLQWLFAVSFPHDIYNLQWLHFTKYVNCRICSTLDSSVIILTFFSPVLRILITFVFWMLIFIHSKLMYSVLVLSFVACVSFRDHRLVISKLHRFYHYPIDLHSIFNIFQSLFNQILDVYGNGNSDQPCLTTRSNWQGSDCMLLNLTTTDCCIRLTDQSPISTVVTQPYQGSHQLIPIDSVKRIFVVYEADVQIFVVLQTSFSQGS